jgi:hypothetical protein
VLRIEVVKTSTVTLDGVVLFFIIYSIVYAVSGQALGPIQLPIQLVMGDSFRG